MAQQAAQYAATSESAAGEVRRLHEQVTVQEAALRGAQAKGESQAREIAKLQHAIESRLTVRTKQTEDASTPLPVHESEEDQLGGAMEDCSCAVLKGWGSR